MPDRFTRFMNPFTERMNRPSIVRDGTAYAVAEMLLSGITTIVDHGGEVLTQEEVLAEMGMRGGCRSTLQRIKGRSSCEYPYLFRAMERVTRW